MFSILVAAPTAANAERRIALLVGNKDYKPGVGALVNTLNDVRVVGEALKAVGFEVLKPVQNGSRAVMLRAIHDFALKLKSAGPDAVGFLYYSGHGSASVGENYLIPIDVDEPSTIELNVQGVKHSEVLAILRGEAPNAAHYLVLDACRNTLQGARGGKGFLPVGQQSGVLVAFAAEPGKTASDIGTGSGPYAAALATELVKPGQSDLIMFHNVRVAVMEKTSGDQVPWTEDGIQRRERVLFGGEAKPAAGLAVTPTPTRLSEAAEAWSATKDTVNIAVLEAFMTRFKDTFFAELARIRIDELKRSQTAVIAVPKPDKDVHARSMIAITQLGLTVVPSTGTNKKGAVVNKVDSGSDAALKGIKSGDVITDVDTREIHSPEDLASAVNAEVGRGHTSVVIRVISGGEPRWVGLRFVSR